MFSLTSTEQPACHLNAFHEHTETYWESPDPSPCVILKKAIHAGVGWVWLAKLVHGYMLLFRVLCAVRTWLRSHRRLHCTLLFVIEGVESLETWRGCSFVVKCGNTWKSAHPLWQTCKVLCPWALIGETTVQAESDGINICAGTQNK